MTGWKPIATAPKDGRNCLVWRHGWSEPTSMFFATNRGHWATDCWFCDAVNGPTHWYDFGGGKTMPDAPEVE